MRLFANKFQLLFSLSMLIFLPAGLYPIQAQAIPCANETTDAGMRRCESGRYEAAEKQLDKTYRTLLGQLSPGARAKLTSAQTAWHRFALADARFVEATEDGGTLGPLLQITTLADRTEARAAELKQLLH